MEVRKAIQEIVDIRSHRTTFQLYSQLGIDKLNW